MKVRPSVKKMCDKCKIIRRHGKVLVICENPAISSVKARKKEEINLWHVLLVSTFLATSALKSA